MKRALLFILVASLLVTVSLGQRPRPNGPRPPRPGSPAGPPEQGPPPGELGQPLPPKPPPPPSKSERDREQFLDEATPSERAAFEAADPKARLALIADWKDRRRAREERAFVDALPPQVRAELNSIQDPVAHRARILTLRIDFAMDRAIEEATASGVVNVEEVARIRGLTPRGKADATLDLQKRTLMVRLKPEIDRMPRPLRDELGRLPPKSFFEHPAIDDLRNFRFFTSLERDQLRKLDPAAREAMAVAIESASDHQSMTTVFLPDRLRLLKGLAEHPRKRLAREIRERLDRGPQPSSRPGFRLAPHLFDQLSPEERDVYLNLPDSARHDFAERRFGREALRESRRGPDDPPPPRDGPPPPRGPEGPRRDRDPRPPH